MELPPITGATAEITATLPLVAGVAPAGLRAAFGVALHMHQPTVLGDGDPTTRAADLEPAAHARAPGGGRQPQRAGVPALLRAHRRSGRRAGRARAAAPGDARLLGQPPLGAGRRWARRTCSRRSGARPSPPSRRRSSGSAPCGRTPWSPSTPVPDLELHMLAWRHHFAALFGLPALARVRGFSAPEMDLPIHPDVCFAYVRALRECGYRWLMVQEHTVENPTGPRCASRACRTAWWRATPRARRRRSRCWSRPRARTPSWSVRCSPSARRGRSTGSRSAAAPCRPTRCRSATARTAAS